MRSSPEQAGGTVRRGTQILLAATLGGAVAGALAAAVDWRRILLNGDFIEVTLLTRLWLTVTAAGALAGLAAGLITLLLLALAARRRARPLAAPPGGFGTVAALAVLLLLVYLGLRAATPILRGASPAAADGRILREADRDHRPPAERGTGCDTRLGDRAAAGHGARRPPVASRLPAAHHAGAGGICRRVPGLRFGAVHRLLDPAGPRFAVHRALSQPAPHAQLPSGGAVHRTAAAGGVPHDLHHPHPAAGAAAVRLPDRRHLRQPDPQSPLPSRPGLRRLPPAEQRQLADPAAHRAGSPGLPVVRLAGHAAQGDGHGPPDQRPGDPLAGPPLPGALLSLCQLHGRALALPAAAALRHRLSRQGRLKPLQVPDAQNRDGPQAEPHRPGAGRPAVPV